MTNPIITPDCLYVNGDSWTHGSELINPDSSIQNHFDPVHEAYRLANYWPRLVADHLGVELFNGSEPGGSNDRILRTSMYDISQLVMEGRRPFVIVAWSQLQRFELPRSSDGNLWKSFVNPNTSRDEKVAMEIWKKWSNNRSDVVKWLQQMISLDAFLKINDVSYLSTTVFHESYRLYEIHCCGDDPFFRPYLTQIKKHINLSRHSLNFSMETYLKHCEGVKYGPGAHPLAYGHQLLAEQMLAQIGTRFQIQRQEDQTSAT